MENANSKLDLQETVRPTLIRLEDSIIFGLFERSQFKLNSKIYSPGGLAIEDRNPTTRHGWFAGFSKGAIMTSFFDYFLENTEKVCATMGRYEDPSEHPFSSLDNLPKPFIKRDFGDNQIKETDINFNPQIMKMYFDAIKEICEPGDDSHSYGDSASCDIRVLQDLSKRIHFGFHVAEAKFQGNPEKYSRLVAAQDIHRITAELTNLGIEQEILSRVAKKGERYNLDSTVIKDFYKDQIIPLTKQVEVAYLLERAK